MKRFTLLFITFALLCALLAACQQRGLRTTEMGAVEGSTYSTEGASNVLSTTTTMRRTMPLVPPTTLGTTILYQDGITLKVPLTRPDATMPVFEPERLEVYTAEGVQGAWELPYVPICRSIYYEIPGYISDIVGGDKFDEYIADYNKKRKDRTIPPKEMSCKSFVEYFNIPKDVFVAAVLANIDIDKQMGKECNTNEANELPNPDIIYTFDDDIINEYYRRK